MAIKITKSDSVFQGKVFDVRIDHIETATGKTQRIDFVKHAGGVTIIPLDEKEQILLVRQYRHPVNRVTLELPAVLLRSGPQTTAR